MIFHVNNHRTKRKNLLWHFINNHSYTWLFLVLCKSDEEIDAVASITDDNKDEDVKMIKIFGLAYRNAVFKVNNSIVGNWKRDVYSSEINVSRETSKN